MLLAGVSIVGCVQHIRTCATIDSSQFKDILHYGVQQMSRPLTAEYSAVSATLLLYTYFIHITKHELERPKGNVSVVEFNHARTSLKFLLKIFESIVHHSW